MALLLLAAGPASAARFKAGREVVHPEARFKMTVPAGWAQTLMGPAELGAGASGAVFKTSLKAGRGGEGRIIVVFYAAGNPHFKDAAEFMARQTATLPVTPVGETTGPIESGALGSLPGKSFMRTKRESKDLVTAADASGGFYAVTCSAHTPVWKRLEPLFKMALTSFSILPPPP